ncbi:MAG TPA: ABC transporter permease [Terriglobia bacterium]|nr:ABC transporter permease [Terriglobia bacterium]
MNMLSALRMVQRNALVYRHVWRGSVTFSFLQPTLFLIAMGIGVGSLIQRGDTTLLGGFSFLQFLAPGLLASFSMQTASFESSFPVTGKMTWFRNYEAIATTPVRIQEIVIGELAWFGLRIATIATAFTAVMTAFRIPRSPMVLLAIPAAVLTGLAFSAAIMAYAATLKTGAHFNILFRFIITPLFLFSGVFFPIARLPRMLRIFAWFTPLFHGVELTRGFTLNTIHSNVWMIHVAYLLVMLAIGILASFRTFRRKLWA